MLVTYVVECVHSKKNGPWPTAKCDIRGCTWCFFETDSGGLSVRHRILTQRRLSASEGETRLQRMCNSHRMERQKLGDPLDD